MTNVLPAQQDIVDKIYNFIITSTDNTTFANYINFLTSIKNVNLHIIDNNVFVSFIVLHKRKLFTKDDILEAMKLK